MRISDWSSDVCSSDLPVGFRTDRGAAMPGTRTGIMDRHRIGLVLDHEARAAAARVPNLDHPLRVAQAQAVQRVLRSALGELPAPLFQPVEHRKRRRRSEEHTSELQSLMRTSYAVLCLKKT